MNKNFYGIILFALGLVGCGGGSEEGIATINQSQAFVIHSNYDWKLPAGFPTPRQPLDNPMSAAKVELGRFLFYDTRMSVNNTFSCASCHEQRMAFTDGRKTAIGATGEIHPRNSMSLVNTAYNSAFNWANPMLKSLHQQALIPMFGEFPVELGWANQEEKILDNFRIDVLYQERFAKAFPNETHPINSGNISKAVAAFTASLISGNSPYDKQVYQNQKNALSESAKRGMELFFSETLECFHCHGGFNFTQSSQHDKTIIPEIEFHNTGLYNIAGTGAYPDNGGRGLWESTFKAEDMGRFRAPTLRNIELTAPYMHDGSIATLEEVLMDHYARGGRMIATGDYAGDGKLNPFKSELINGFRLSASEKEDMIAFLKSLTDWEFICDACFKDPFGNIPDHQNCFK
ncbi:methanobactin export MATE transporter MbnM [Thioflexithrix psekupsensis]|uniref:Di-heme enzyme n=1 Tax=Thioflexithrix psekupsensis TaxID=1570016 RepID=A0A251XDA7_9GAMM|nr:methanobactin export MATE transporter MbnM [Thioflexithrix psekupsensis]OUD16321.1 di-heme enzyme [Thioflexithrix psekupsensis]